MDDQLLQRVATVVYFTVYFGGLTIATVGLAWVARRMADRVINWDLR
jgi:hypothetical protein